MVANPEAELLRRLIETRLAGYSIAFIHNEGDPQAKPGDLVAELFSSACVGRKLLLIQRGNVLEVAYWSGVASDTGTAEKQFAYRPEEAEDALGSAIDFVQQILNGEVIVVRARVWPFGKKTYIRFAQCDAAESREVVAVESWSE